MAMCFICLETRDKPISLLQCKKQCICDGLVHSDCIAAWFKHTPICPICRKSIYKTLIKEHVKYDLIIYAVWTITVLIIIFVLPADEDYYY